MNTPIYDFVSGYASSGISRLHMPGHKGRGALGCEGLDITEVSGADSLYEASGIIRESENNAASLFGSRRTFYSTEGSTQCIKAMLYLAAKRAGGGGTVIAARNAHKSFVHACALLDLNVRWLYSEDTGFSVCSCRITPETVERAIVQCGEKPIAVYITTPNYLGELTDVKVVSAVCKKNGVPLLVDNAHGAYLKFLDAGLHPLEQGADLCCDSAHKTLPVLTGGAYLHIGRGAPAELDPWGPGALALFGSTSPSYLILQSLDLCNRELAGAYPERLRQLAETMERLKNDLNGSGVPVLPSEPLRLVVDAAAMGYTGRELGEALRRGGAEAELADEYFVVCMVTPDNSYFELFKLRNLLVSITKRTPIVKTAARITGGEQVMTIRRAVMAQSKEVDITNATGKICANVTSPCPPAVPAVISGERVTEKAVELMKRYGIERIEVVK